LKIQLSRGRRSPWKCPVGGWWWRPAGNHTEGMPECIAGMLRAGVREEGAARGAGRTNTSGHFRGKAEPGGDA
jgi:hypothetical protein